MKPTEKAEVIRRIFVCYVYNLFVYVLTAQGCTYSKQNTVNMSVCIVHFHRKKLKDIIRIWLLKSGITIIMLCKDDLELGHPVPFFIFESPPIESELL